MSDNENCRVMCRSMMYTQHLRDLPAGTIKQLVELLEEMAPKKYALIVHDKDVNVWGESIEDHVHVMLSFKNARSINSVAKKLRDRPQYLQMWKCKEEIAYFYLIHATTGDISKHQYPPERVIANFDYPKEILRLKNTVKSRKG